MGIGDKVGQMAGQIQDGVKTSSISMVSTSIKVITAFFIGLTLALIGQEAIQYGTIGFVFMMVVSMGLIYRLIAKWTIASTLIFDLICVLVAVVLRMYIQLAP